MTNRKLLYRLYKSFNIALAIRLLGLSIIVLLYFIQIQNLKNGEEIYCDPRFLEIHVIGLMVAIIPIWAKAYRSLRYSTFALYTLVDLINCFVLSILSIVWKDYHVPFPYLEQNMITFYIVISLLLSFKIVHLVITFAIVIINIKTPKHLYCSPEEIMKSRGKEVDQRVISLPLPPNDPPPSYMTVMSVQMTQHDDPPPPYITAIKQKCEDLDDPPPPPPSPPPPYITIMKQTCQDLNE